MRIEFRRVVAGVAAGPVLGGLLGCFLGGAAAPAIGQDLQAREVITYADGQAEPATLAVAFPGGTVGEYIEALRGAAENQPVNIAVSASAQGAMLPEVRMDRVTIGTALAAIEYIAPTGPGERWIIASLDRGRSNADSYAITLVRKSAPEQTTTQAAAGRTLKVFSIKELLDPAAPNGNAETVLSAVELALRMDAQPEAVEPEVKYHPDSGLLILSASPQQVGAIADLLGRLENDTQRMRGRMEQAMRERQQNAMTVRINEAKLNAASARLGHFKAALDHTRQLHEGGFVSDGEVRAAEMSVLDASSDCEIIGAELEAARQRADQQVGDAGEVADLRRQVAALRARIKELESGKK